METKNESSILLRFKNVTEDRNLVSFNLGVQRVKSMKQGMASLEEDNLFFIRDLEILSHVISTLGIGGISTGNLIILV